MKKDALLIETGHFYFIKAVILRLLSALSPAKGGI
jgi:hypothetical protein